MSKHFHTFLENESMRFLFSDVNDLTYICDTEGNILFLNKIFEKFAGCGPEEYYGKPFITLYNEEDQKKAKDAYARALKGESPHYELYFRNTGILCDYKNFPLRDEKGNIVGVMSVARDITTRRRSEEGLMALNKSLEKRVMSHTAKLVEVNEELMQEIETRKRLEGELKRSIGKLQKSLQGVIQTLALTVESKNTCTVGHQRRVTEIACCIAEEMGLVRDRIETIQAAACLHDIGKISVPYEILCSSGRLAEAELSMIMSHPKAGHDILKEMEFPWPVAQIVLQHHERVDGSGYPSGLSGKDVLLEAKILGVADVVESISAPRLYRADYGLDKALDEISQKRGTLYDFNVVHACLIIFKERGFRFGQGIYSDSRLTDD